MRNDKKRKTDRERERERKKQETCCDTRENERVNTKLTIMLSLLLPTGRLTDGWSVSNLSSALNCVPQVGRRKLATLSASPSLSATSSHCSHVQGRHFFFLHIHTSTHTDYPSHLIQVKSNQIKSSFLFDAMFYLTRQYKVGLYFHS